MINPFSLKLALILLKLRRKFFPKTIKRDFQCLVRLISGYERGDDSHLCSRLYQTNRRGELSKSTEILSKYHIHKRIYPYHSVQLFIECEQMNGVAQNSFYTHLRLCRNFRIILIRECMDLITGLKTLDSFN